MKTLLISILLSSWFYPQEVTDIKYTVTYYSITQTCHYCNKALTSQTPKRIYNVPSNYESTCLAIESAKMFETALKVKKFENEECTSTSNRNTEHVFLQNEMRSTEVVKSRIYSEASANQLINYGVIQEFGTLYPTTLEESYGLVLAAYQRN
jgi:hypothetical protein